jgi:hypothetical protein
MLMTVRQSQVNPSETGKPLADVIFSLSRRCNPYAQPDLLVFNQLRDSGIVIF